MHGVLMWLDGNPLYAWVILVVAVYGLAMLLKIEVVQKAIIAKIVRLLETESCRPAREEIARSNIGSLADKVIENLAADADPEEEKRGENKLKRAARWLPVIGGIVGLFKK